MTSGMVLVQAELKEMIQSASARGELWTRDWDTMPLPSSLTADGGAAAKQAAQAAAAAISAKVQWRLSLRANPLLTCRDLSVSVGQRAEALPLGFHCIDYVAEHDLARGCT